eukprot:218153-Chlamydomonas_euryale.AAC.1
MAARGASVLGGIAACLERCVWGGERRQENCAHAGGRTHGPGEGRVEGWVRVCVEAGRAGSMCSIWLATRLELAPGTLPYPLKRALLCCDLRAMPSSRIMCKSMRSSCETGWMDGWMDAGAHLLAGMVWGVVGRWESARWGVGGACAHLGGRISVGRCYGAEGQGMGEGATQSCTMG